VAEHSDEEIVNIALQRPHQLFIQGLQLGQAGHDANQQVGLAGKVVIDGPLRHAGCPGNLFGSGTVKALLSEHGGGSVEDLVAPRLDQLLPDGIWRSGHSALLVGELSYCSQR